MKSLSQKLNEGWPFPKDMVYCRSIAFLSVDVSDQSTPRKDVDSVYTFSVEWVKLIIVIFTKMTIWMSTICWYSKIIMWLDNLTISIPLLILAGVNSFPLCTPSVILIAHWGNLLTCTITCLCNHFTVNVLVLEEFACRIIIFSWPWIWWGPTGKWLTLLICIYLFY